MDKKRFKEFSTSLSALVFVVISVTGVMLYFHLFNSYTKKLHEIIGLGFVLFVLLHVSANWTLMKKYFSKKIFYALLVVVVIFSTFMVLTNANSQKANQKLATKQIINSTFNLPINKALMLLNIDENTAKQRLQAKKMNVENFNSINQIAKQNNTSSYAIYLTLSNK